MQLSIIPLRLAMGMALMLSSVPAWAVELEPVKLGFLDVIPEIHSKVSQAGTMSLFNGEEQRSDLLLFNPRVTAQASDGENRFSTSLEIQNGNYSVANTDDYIDWKLDGTAHVALGEHNALQVQAELFSSHEEPGNVFGGPDNAHVIPNEFNVTAFDISYQQHSPQSKIRMVLEASNRITRYTNNKAATRSRNQNVTDWSSSLLLRVLPRTDLVLKYQHKGVDFLEEELQRSHLSGKQVSTTYLGATWQAPDSIPGNLKIGYNLKFQSQLSNTNISSTSWETNLRWQPLSSSLITLDAGRMLRAEGGHDRGYVSLLDTRNVHYSWEQSWSASLKSSIAADYFSKVHVDSNHRDYGHGLKFTMNYVFSNWLEMFMAFAHERRVSVMNQLDFSEQTYRLGIEASLDWLLQ